MLVTILDNSVPFDGRSPEEVPLGGPEKGVIALAYAYIGTIKLALRTS